MLISDDLIFLARHVNGEVLSLSFVQTFEKSVNETKTVPVKFLIHESFRGLECVA